jgi:hypothetical protein
MKFWFVLAPLVACGAVASGQDHLSPERGVLTDPHEYHYMISQVFLSAYEPEVFVRCVVLPSFRMEYVVGLRETEDGVEAFRVEASSHIWDIVCVKDYESGQVVVFGKDGKEVPLERNRIYQDLKKRTPPDYHQIKTVDHRRPLPKPLAEDIGAIWRTMLLDARYPDEIDRSKDGVTSHYSAEALGRGAIGGQLRNKGTGRAGALTGLRVKLDEYVLCMCDLEVLSKELEAAKAAIKPRQIPRKRDITR